ncbi:16S rRNA (adenine(1518)-N(6)/adenine(1519)-N(6))-dimethyltransferase RsmA [Helicobacter fennelliae]|uniref:Ribosomal RNA small subunit methyltransferase A n=2 Tax=Helicobacter fennelliae TaxID=215 RepID=T1DVM0_9HELI|nr:16S rRNA (adenine(1518)-N(6)/adenine(1519)-N(6))-dimethyltransferase RsmA [Helicobacter fennelliae]GAD18672.1 SSU rRNA (adenine(1518)-N(6)/adenine(1519)-N(6)) -dimethyltransferase [Helicobacter fennelliae MRY12-0050]SQB97346.1 dimethyladenosine transferase [Helicobacter fennelliae]STP07150.1 dimethyladenosine transferase [Helicobacter fennelliae]STQ83302.1 dimethyladenosine transferase [Helicobacter fennelliae]
MILQPEAKKYFGQNFLKDSAALDRIVQSVSDIRENNKLIEIGVGLGDLSERLLRLSSLKTYEIDTNLCSFVLRKFQKSHKDMKNNFTLIECDVLSLPFQEGWLENEKYILVSNLPYYIATRIVINVIKDPLCRGFVVMTQKEVAQKFCANEADKQFCALSVLAQSVGEVQILFDVAPECFEPMPKVFSSVFKLTKSDETRIEAGFENMLKIAFNAPRKKLLNNLATQYDKPKLESIFTQLGISLDKRPHEVSTQNYHHIYQYIKD